MAQKFLVPIDLNKNELQNARLQNLSTPPSSPVLGQVYYDTDTNTIFFWNGAWTELSSSTGLTQEQVEDIIGAMVTGNTETNITVTYDDTNGKLDFVVGATYTDEMARDAIGTALTAGNNIDITVNDAGDTITIDVEGLTSADISDFSEAVDDRVGSMLTAGNNIDLTYDDVANTLTVDVEGLTSADLSDFNTAVDERARDAVGTALTAGNNIDITVNDAGDTITIDVEALTSADLSDFNEAAQDAVGTILVDSTTVDFTYTDATPSITAAVIDDSITYAKMQNVSAASRVIGRGSAAGAGDPQELTLGASVIMNGTVIERAALTGDVTATQNSNATTIAADVVSNTKLANMAANTIKGNNTGGAADPADLTTAQVKTMLAIVPGDVTGFDTQVRTSRLDQMAAPTASVSLNSQKITNLADGTATTDAATFGQLSAAIQGFDWKEPVRAATTANIANLATGAPNTVDGITPVVGDRILVKDQSTTSQNGIYTVTTVGTGANGVWARATDADAAGEINNATVLIEAGTVGAGDIYTQTATVATLGTDAVTWVKSAEGNTVYTADGTSLTLTGTQFSVTSAGITATHLAAAVAGNGLAGGAGTALSVNTGTASATGLEISSDTVRIAADAAGNGLTGGGGSALAVNTGTGLEISSDAVRIAAAAAGAGLTGGAGSALAVGAGTGIVVNADDVAVNRTGTNGVHVPLFYSATIGDAAATSIAVTHNLGQRWCHAQVFDASTGEMVMCDITMTSTTQTTFGFAVAPALNALRVVITG